MSHPRPNPRPILATLGLILAVALVGCGTDSAKIPDSPTIPDEAPPMSPNGVRVEHQTSAKFLLSWSPNTESDLGGYRVYLYDPNPGRTDPYVCLTGSTPYSRTQLSVSGQVGFTYHLRISAVDQTGNESAMSDPLTYTFLPIVDGLEEQGQQGDHHEVDEPGRDTGITWPIDTGGSITRK